MNLKDKLFSNSYDLLEKGTELLFGLNGKDVNIEKAYEYFLLSAKKGNLNAQQILDNQYADGKVELREEFKAIYPLMQQMRKDVESGNPEACYLWGVGKLSDEADDYMFQKGVQCISTAANQGHPKAQFTLAMLCLQGNRIPQDKGKGVYLLKCSAEGGNIDALITLYRLGDKEFTFSKLIELADNDNANAAELIGEIYKSENKGSEALKYFEKAAQLGNKDAVFNMAIMYDKGLGIREDKLLAAKWYKVGVENGDPMCMANLGYILECGPTEMRNEKSAFELYLKAAENGYVDSWNNVGLCYKRGIGVSTSFEKAKEAYIKATHGEDPAKSFYNLFLLYTDGIAGEYDEKEASAYLLKAANLGLAAAQYHLALRYIIGLGITQDIEKGLKELVKAAEQNDPNAINDAIALKNNLEEGLQQISFNYLTSFSYPSYEAKGKLGHYYSNGWGCPQNLKKAFDCYKEAALMGIAEAQYDLGICYRFGQGVRQDYGQAVLWYENAVRQDFPKAMVNLGIMYDHGMSVAKNEAQAFELYNKAAQLGDKEGQCCVGLMYFEGRHVKQDYAEAVKWFEKAAEQGEPDSIFHLGVCFLHGLGVERDINKAKNYLYHAHALGFTPAIDYIKQIKLDQL